MKKKIVTLVVALCMVLSLVTALGLTASAGSPSTSAESYLYPTYNTTDNPTSGISGWATGSITSYRSVTSETSTLNSDAYDGWYVVDGQVETGPLTVSGNVKLLLKDGASLTVTGALNAGICVSGDANSLTVYAQSTDSTTMGKLTATGGYEGAGIGGNKGQAGSNITINGGAVTATAGTWGAGIGGGKSGAGSNITVNGGTVTATGNSGGTGIGGGCSATGSNITVNGGTVVAIGNSGAKGIGNGAMATGSSGNITVATTLDTGTGANADNLTLVSNDGTDLAAKLTGACVKIGAKYDYPVYKTTTGDFYTKASSGIAAWKLGIGTGYTVINATNMPTTWGTADTETWYVVEGTVDYTEGGTKTNGITVAGNVHLILKDGASLTVTGADEKAGICVSGDANSLTVYAQSTDSATMGKLTATGGGWGAGIGGGFSGAGSNITVNGGAVSATGGANSVGIGGSRQCPGFKITVNGGTVTATGGQCGAGIGGGNQGTGNNITVNGGTVTATGGMGGGAGIGGGSKGSCSNITVNGGTVVAIGKSGAKGIGSGNSGSAASGITVATTLDTGTGADANSLKKVENDGTDLAAKLTGACVKIGLGYNYPTYNKTNGSFYENASSGIKEWWYGVRTGDEETIVINSANKPASWGATGKTTWYVVEGTVDYGTGGITVVGDVHLILKDGASLTVTGAYNNAGICVTDPNSLTVYAQSNGSTMGKLTATGGKYDAGIGGGNYATGSNITINGGTVTANGGYGGAGFGGDYGGVGSNITVNGGTVTATGGTLGAGIGGGKYGNAKNIIISGGTVTATGSQQGAGIGSGDGYGCSSAPVAENITISAGTVTATGGKYGAGIGGGSDSNAKNITISGGTVTATGGQYGAGIGGGDCGTGSNILISTSLLTKADGNATPTTVIPNEGKDLASKLAGQRYATIVAGTQYAIGRTLPGDLTIGLKIGDTDITETLTATEGNLVTITFPDIVGFEKTIPEGATVVDAEKGIYTIVMPGNAIEADKFGYTLVAFPTTEPETEYAASLTLNESIDINLYVKNYGTINLEGLTVKVDGEAIAVTEKDSVLRGILASIAPCEMSKEITTVISYYGVEVKTFTYSVRKYCEAIFDHEDYGIESELGQLCVALLNYGKWAEDYYAEQNNTGAAPSTVNADYQKDFAATTIPTDERVCFRANGTITGAAAYLTLKSRLTLHFRLYTEKELNAEDIVVMRKGTGTAKQVSADTVTLTPVADGYDVNITEISASDLCCSYTLTINGEEDFFITYSVTNYCSVAQNYNGTLFTDRLKTLCKALYTYSEAVKAYNESLK